MSIGAGPQPCHPAGSLPGAGPGTAGYLRLPHGSPQLPAELGLVMGLASWLHAHHGVQDGCRDKDLLGQRMHGHSLGVLWHGEAGVYALGITAAGHVPEGGCPGCCVTPSWPATAFPLLVWHQATQLLVSSRWLGEHPELVLKPALKEGACELEVGGQHWQKLASPQPASPKGSSECWLQAGEQHAPWPQRTEGLPRQAHQVPRSSIARECS